MTIVFGGPEALEILKRDAGLRAEAERNKYVEIVADFRLAFEVFMSVA